MQPAPTQASVASAAAHMQPVGGQPSTQFQASSNHQIPSYHTVPYASIPSHPGNPPHPGDALLRLKLCVCDAICGAGWAAASTAWAAVQALTSSILSESSFGCGPPLHVAQAARALFDTHVACTQICEDMAGLLVTAMAREWGDAAHQAALRARFRTKIDGLLETVKSLRSEAQVYQSYAEPALTF